MVKIDIAYEVENMGGRKSIKIALQTRLSDMGHMQIPVYLRLIS